jgi:hypothetical protein
MSEQPITYEQLAIRWGIGVRQAKRRARVMKIPILDFGYRTKRIRPVDVDRAEAKLAGEKNQGGVW